MQKQITFGVVQNFYKKKHPNKDLLPAESKDSSPLIQDLISGLLFWMGSVICLIYDSVNTLEIEMCCEKFLTKIRLQHSFNLVSTFYQKQYATAEFILLSLGFECGEIKKVWSV